MPVDFDSFYEWAKDHFGEENLKIRNTAHGTEICTHSIWSEKKLGKTDNKYHLWMNPTGGKSKHPGLGSYRCWLTDEMGSLISLVAEIDNLDWEQAETLLCGGSSLRDLEQQVHEFFEQKVPTINQNQIKPVIRVELPSSSYLIDKMPSNHTMKLKAEAYLKKRKISNNGLYVCVAGNYKNRIILPYYSATGELVYYNARTMNEGKNTLRYMKCPTTVVDQKEVLYMTDWPKSKSKVYIMEGEFDAITLKMSGVTGCACGGKFMSDTQIDLIKQYEPVLAFDADDAGLEAMLNIGNSLLDRGFSKVGYIRPPKAFKDWNGLLVNRNIETVKEYLSRFEKNFTKDTPAVLLSNRL
jgi:DNA primase